MLILGISFVDSRTVQSCHDYFILTLCLRYCTFCTLSHMFAVPKLCVGKREAHINWSIVKPEHIASVTGTIVRTTGPVSADSRQ